MAYVIEIPNSFDPTTARKHRTRAGITIRGWLREQHPGFTEFPTPTICILNGEYLLRKDWEREIQEGDVVTFATAPEGPFIIIAILVIAIALTFVLMGGIAPPAVPGEAPASDPVFSTKGQQNAIRLGEPIEVCYGRNRIYPSYAARPYFQYEDNDQFQYSLFCLGQGSYDIQAIQIGDTSIDSYQEVTYEIIEPGGTVHLFPTNVITSAEAGGQTLFAPNEDEYVAPGYVGPFPANPSGTEAYKIQVDMIFPKGLYALPDSGSLQSLSINFTVEARTIDNLGVPTGSYVAIGTEVYTASTTTAQRKTFTYTVSPARYEVRVRRTDTKNLSYRAGHDIVWEGLRAFVGGTAPAWGDVTLLAVVIRATNNLNDRTQQQFNIIATRKLPTLQSDGVIGTALSATRGIIPAFVDAAKALYGGRIVDNSFFDWESLARLDATYTSLGLHFDWIFRDPITVWEALQTIAHVGRALPILIGSLITMKRDSFTEIPVAMFTPDNIISQTFEWDIRLWDLDEYDSIRVEYTEPATGYKQEKVVAVLPGGTSDNPKDVRFPGIQDRNHAYREGLFMLAGDKYCRENVVFDTGLEGYILTYGDLVAVVHTVPRWGQFGFVIKAEMSNESSAGRYHVWVSEPLVFGESGEHQIMFRGRHGEVIGPFTAIQTSNSSQVVVDMLSSGDFDFLEGGENEPMLFCFGVAGQITRYCKIVKIEPQGGEGMRLTAVNDAPIIYSFDELVAPELNSVSLPPAVPDLPEIKALFVSQTDPTLQIVQVAWTAAFGAQYYVVQTSQDGITWKEQITTVRTALQFQFRPGDFWVRVAAVNSGRGPWISDHRVLSNILGIDLLQDWAEETSFKVGWLAVLNAQYQVQVFDMTESDPVLRRTTIQTDTTFTYDIDDATEDHNIGHRHQRAEVDTVFGGVATGAPISVDLYNFMPPPVTNVVVTRIGVESSGASMAYHVTWDLPHQDDLIRVAVWLSPVNGFDAFSTDPYAEYVASHAGWTHMPGEAFVGIPLESPGDHPTYYMRIGLFDVWGNEIETGSGGNVTDQITIPAYP